MKLSVGFAAWLALAQAGLPLPQVAVQPSTSNVSIGERFQVTVEVKGDPSATYEFPGELSTAAVEMKLSRPVSRAASTAVYDAQVFALGAEARIPEIEVRY